MRHCCRRLCHFAAVEASVGGEVLRLQTGRLARMADGCVEARLGQTAVLVTAVGGQRCAPGPFMPLTVDYRNRFSAYGRIPTNFFRREAVATEADVLTSRLVDRSVRPGFTSDCYADCQLVCTLLAHDGHNDADVLAINAASASLLCSPIPWHGPVAAIRVGWSETDDCPVVSPSSQQLRSSPFSLILSCNDKGNVLMLDGCGRPTSVDAIVRCVQAGIAACAPILKAMDRMRQAVAIDKRPTASVATAEAMATMAALGGDRLIQVFADHQLDKVGVDQRIAAVKQELARHWQDAASEPPLFDLLFTDLVRTTLRQYVFSTDRRRDGRQLDELRPIDCQVDLYPPLHGSALFQRGQSQVLCTVTFDSKQAAFRGDMGLATTEKRFMLQYTFSPFATNEMGATRSANRREMGHGALAEKALRCIVPGQFPFTIRLTADVLESNGSTSMGSVCAGSMALMDAGVPVDSAVAGVAVGLMTHAGQQRILTDITGMEDFFGDMDFKVACSADGGVTAMQLDTKLANGIDRVLFGQALDTAVKANLRTLARMQACIARPRDGGAKANGPAEQLIDVAPGKRARLLGPGGINLKRLEADTGAQIVQTDDSHFCVFVADGRRMPDVLKAVDQLLTDDFADSLQFGAVCTVRIVQLMDSGALVSLHPSLPPVFIANSQLDSRRVGHPEKLGLRCGQEVCVKYFGRDPVTGHLRLSRKVLQQLDNHTSSKPLNLLDRATSGQRRGAPRSTDDSPS